MTDDTEARRLQLAIEHITVATQAWITAKGQELARVHPDLEVVNVFSTQGCWATMVPPDLGACLDHAREAGYDSLTFNTSGAVVPELPRYED